jgi:hypothetical protein
MKKLIWVLLLASAPALATEAPFCLVYPTGRMACVYVLLDVCQREAEYAHGMCVPNPNR